VRARPLTPLSGAAEATETPSTSAGGFRALLFPDLQDSCQQALCPSAKREGGNTRGQASEEGNATASETVSGSLAVRRWGIGTAQR
jgi:hypothetical protein